MIRGKNKEKFNKIVEDIEQVKIQGAQNIAKKALEAYKLFPNKRSKKKLLSLRPTEPLLKNILDSFTNENTGSLEENYKKIENHFEETQKKINQLALKLIKNNDVIFTHCHSSTVTKALVHAKEKGRKFQVHVTETRPLYQGRKTAKELSKANIKTTLFVDSAAGIALTGNQETEEANKFFIGADALLNQGIVNKIGSGMLSQIAYKNKIPLYVFSDSWKYSKEKVKMEQRSFKEIWNPLRKKSNLKIKIKNPAFEFVEKRYIYSIVSELGIRKYNDFLKKVKNV
jgi:translation initiation factor 2B subunit (eIF-2B alpha/beta/delta family)